MKDHSIYCALYNTNKMQFPWRETLDNWTRFLNGSGQVVIAVNTSEDDTFESVTEFTRELAARPDNQVEYTVFKTEIPYTNPLFDGMIKNEALKRCNRHFRTLLDIDEVIPLWNRAAWEETKRLMNFYSEKIWAIMIPSIDLFHDEKSYRSIGQKWYIHTDEPYFSRGAVKFAKREDGTIDINKSDSTELLWGDGHLYDAIPMLYPHWTAEQKLELIKTQPIPIVYHLGWLDKQQRLRQSAFWAPVWSARDGRKIEKPLTEQDLDKIPYYPHGLKHWNEE